MIFSSGNAVQSSVMPSNQFSPLHWLENAYVRPPTCTNSSSSQKKRFASKLRPSWALASFAFSTKSSPKTSPSTDTNDRLLRGPQCAATSFRRLRNQRRDADFRSSRPSLLLRFPLARRIPHAADEPAVSPAARNQPTIAALLTDRVADTAVASGLRCSTCATW